MAVKNLADLLAEGVEGRGVLVRCDLNVPLNEAGTITDTGRIDASAPTLKALSDAGAKVVVTGRKAVRRPSSRSLRWLPPWGSGWGATSRLPATWWARTHSPGRKD